MNNDNIFSTQQWQSWAVTDVGKRRKCNEDAVLNRPDAGLWVVADGMGGHEAGDVASQLIVSSLEKLALSDDLDTNITAVRDCIKKVNAQLRALARQQSAHQIIGSTVVALLATKHRCAVLWAGDSRLYRLRNYQLQQLTQDHCPDYGLDADAWAVKSINEITRAVGADDELNLDCDISELLDSDIFLLCSDGLDKELSLKEIEQVMLTNAPETLATTLLDMTLQRGAKDNVSIIAIAVTS